MVWFHLKETALHYGAITVELAPTTKRHFAPGKDLFAVKDKRDQDQKGPAILGLICQPKLGLASGLETSKALRK
ncbi:hypothetical protein AV530_005188 [Patagioenas fasciata monilis]|uniref:Uncharacterized protein n=1 Tax=Patagioenas fasciata monilis TaxID=372326 RepID=A0A1V4K4K0_PATFA|nr:hypothetical protein AV530_005188 [Patagioenas fasciata monilis]